MEHRMLGSTGVRLSALGFGCGNVGGLLIRASAAERERAVARALELGINYFDTAPLYGNGESERNLGAALRALRADARVGTKLRIGAAPPEAIPELVTKSIDESLRRLGREQVDLVQLHDAIGSASGARSVPVRTLLDVLVPTLEKLIEQGKTRFFGITALGETAALLQAIDSGSLASAQVCFNLLNPSAAYALPASFPGHDFGGLLHRAQARGMGAIAIRALAAGALSGSDERHPIAVPQVGPIASGPDYATDVARATRFGVLVESGHVGSLVEAAIRFALSSDAISTVLVGYSSIEQLETAAAAAEKGPLSPAALAQIEKVWSEIALARR
jgi:aryl-alcohol dehydrogenase-like predicted oxidoreductase